MGAYVVDCIWMHMVATSSIQRDRQTDGQPDTALDGPPHVHLRVYQLQCDTVDVVVLENDGSASNLMDDLTLLR